LSEGRKIEKMVQDGTELGPTYYMLFPSCEQCPLHILIEYTVIHLFYAYVKVSTDVEDDITCIRHNRDKL
jgi:hypothetical protein